MKNSFTIPILEEIQKRRENMIIIFNGDTLQLKDCLKRFSGATEKVTLDFMLRNFKIMESEDNAPTETIKEALDYLGRNRRCQ